MWTREMLKSNAKQVLRRNYLIPFVVCILAVILTGDFKIGNFYGTIVFPFSQDSVSEFMMGMLPLSVPFYVGVFGFSILIAFATIVLRIFILNPLEVGKARFFVNNIEQEEEVGTLFSFFSDPNYMNIVKILLIRDIKIFLWTLCLLIPGIYKSYEYYMVAYILAEDSSLTTQEVFDRTKVMTDNQKLDIFVLNLSFILWYMACGLTFGIGNLFLNPYISATDAELYYVLKNTAA